MANEMRPISRLLTDRNSLTGDTTLIVKLQGGVDAANDMLQVIGPGEYETVAASQTDQVLGSTGAAGDYLDKLIITVGTAAPPPPLVLKTGRARRFRSSQIRRVEALAST